MLVARDAGLTLVSAAQESRRGLARMLPLCLTLATCSALGAAMCVIGIATRAEAGGLDERTARFSAAGGDCPGPPVRAPIWRRKPGRPDVERQMAHGSIAGSVNMALRGFEVSKTDDRSR